MLPASTEAFPVPSMNLRAQYASIKDEIDAAIAHVVESQHFIMGPQVQECEAAVAKYSDCDYGVGVSSGSDALLMTLMAEGIGPGDEVITTPYSFFATAGCISRVGATPVFVDIDLETFNINHDLIEDAITAHTKAIIPVHLYGQMSNMVAIMRIAEQHGLAVIEDAAQAIGSEFAGRRVGSYGKYGCLSFFPAKNLGAYGDGGMIVTSDEAAAEKLRVLRVHGSKPKYYHHVIGGNFRLDTIHAAIVHAKLKYLDEWTEARQKLAQRYIDLLMTSGLIEQGHLKLPALHCSRHVFNQFVIKTPQRDALMAFLKGQQIACGVYYPKCLHEQECFSDLNYQAGDFPMAERASQESLAVPIYPEMPVEHVDRVVQCMQEFFRTV